MNDLERLQAAIAQRRRRWTEKYGRVPREECRHPMMDEEMRSEMEMEWTREADACIRMVIASAQRSGDDVATSGN